MDKQSQTLLIVFIAVAAFSLLVHAASMLAVALGARKAQQKIMALADDVRLHALPVIMSSREVIQDIGPRLKTITANLEVTSTVLRNKSEQVSGLVGDVTTRAQAQAARVDGMVKGTLDQVNYAVHAVEAGIAAPVRQVSGILNGIRAGLEALRRKTPGENLNPEDDLFV
jgi:citrate lyase gamma subunit